MHLSGRIAAPALIAATFACVGGGARAEVGVATNVYDGFPYFHTGYYHYGPAPFPAVPSAQQQEYSYVFVQDSGAYSAWSHTTEPSNYRSWSMGYRSFGNFGRYHY
jgi:hypothetical protein